GPLPGRLHRPAPPPDRGQCGRPPDRGLTGAGHAAGAQSVGTLETERGPARRPRRRASGDQRQAGQEGGAQSPEPRPPEEILVNHPAARTRRAAQAPPPLPAFVAPMLAQPGAPFDSDDHLFEVKWDGTRMLVFRDASGCRLLNRHGAHRTTQYPEFAGLTQLPVGTILDGEMLVLQQGQPDFGRLLSRDLACQPLKIQRPAWRVGSWLLRRAVPPARTAAG